MSIQRTALPWIAGAAVAQLILLGIVSPAGAVESVAAGAVVLVVPLAASHLLRSWRSWHAMAIAGSLGGLGMLIGALLDAQSSGLPLCHAGHTGHVGLGGLVNWMTGAMLAGCIPGCVWLMPACTRAWQRHAACIAGMMLGMELGGRWLILVLGAMVSAPATHHIAMMLGMMLGAAAGHRALHEEVASDPPGSVTPTTPTRWRTDQAPVPACTARELRGAAER